MGSESGRLGDVSETVLNQPTPEALLFAASSSRAGKELQAHHLQTRVMGHRRDDGGNGYIDITPLLVNRRLQTNEVRLKLPISC